MLQGNFRLPCANLTGDGTNTYQWDAESHLIEVLNGSGTAISTNTYNALGQRVRDVTATSTTEEAYGASGELLWRYTGDSNDRKFVPFEGGILAEYWSGGTLFDHPDEIGSISTASDQTGNNFQQRLYKPFGEFWTGANPDNLGMHQTFSKLPDYDPETDQYNTLNRHYSPTGRWLSPDPGGLKVVRLDDPQTWNMYAYVRNNPTTLSDPSGLGPPEYIAAASPPGLIGAAPGILSGQDESSTRVTGTAQNQAADKPAPQPAPTDPNGKPTPPPVKVPGAPDLPWKWNPNPQNPRGGTWGPDGWKGPNPPNGSWDPNGHWDINGGKGEPVDHYDPKGNPITPGTAHPGNAPTTMMDRMRSITPGPILKWGTAGVVIYIIIDEGSRLYPPRNLVPVP